MLDFANGDKYEGCFKVGREGGREGGEGESGRDDIHTHTHTHTDLPSLPPSLPQDGRMDGEGTLTYEEEKRKYVGGFKQGLKHGKGEYYFPNGSR